MGIQDKLDKIHTARTEKGDAQVKNAFCNGFILIDGVGDSIAEVDFPVMFVEEPNPDFALVLQPNQPVVPGQFPMWSAFVAEWVLQDAGDHHRLWYTGARIGISLASAIPNLHCKLSYKFMAQAFRNPTDGDITAGATL